MKSSNKGLMATIVVLVIMIIGLVVGIVVVNMQKDSQQPEEVVRTDGEIIYEISDTIFRMSTDEAIEYLDEQLEKYAGTNLEYQIKIYKVRAYKLGGMINEAILLAESMDTSEMSDNETMNFYNDLSELYRESGDEEKADYYKEESNRIREESGFEGTGINVDGAEFETMEDDE